jgi:hypothetical protein
MQQIELVITKLLIKARPKIKQALKSPCMWTCVEDLVDDLVDEIWPDVEEEIMFALKYNPFYSFKYLDSSLINHTSSKRKLRLAFGIISHSVGLEEYTYTLPCHVKG